MTSDKCKCATCNNYPFMYVGATEKLFQEMLKDSPSKQELFKRIRYHFTPYICPAKQSLTLTNELLKAGPIIISYLCRALLKRSKPSVIHSSFAAWQQVKEFSGTVKFRRYKGVK